MARTPAALVVFALAACGRLSDSKAEALVREYNARVIEAYRTADPQQVVGLVGDLELKKITGLIGVRQDADLFLDSELVSLVVTAIERPPGGVQVLTEEKWSYRDRHVGDGAQVGEASQDEYAMRYVLQPVGQLWRVERIEFASPPKVGRKSAPLGSGAAHARQPALGAADGGTP
jgi:hypothetical protein